MKTTNALEIKTSKALKAEEIKKNKWGYHYRRSFRKPIAIQLKIDKLCKCIEKEGENEEFNTILSDLQTQYEIATLAFHQFIHQWRGHPDYKDPGLIDAIGGFYIDIDNDEEESRGEKEKEIQREIQIDDNIDPNLDFIPFGELNDSGLNPEWNIANRLYG